jgi:rare lipoprotein A
MRQSGKSAAAALALLLLLLLAGCARHRRIARVPRQPAPKTSVPVGYTEEGIASWYGIPFDGHRAADGEVFHMESLVAAHRLMPFNTWLRVTNLANGKTVNVRVIDRGPFVHGRIIDLSMGAARQIGLLGAGIGRVRLEVISAPIDNPAEDFYAVQVGAFSVRSNAERAQAEYASRYGAAQLAFRQGVKPLWRVLVGREPSIEEAERLAATLRSQGESVFVVRLDPSKTSP